MRKNHFTTANTVILEDRIYFSDYHSEDNNDKADVLHGLIQPQKSLNPKFFYNTKGSELFEKITQLKEYYPARTEQKILKDNAREIAAYCGDGCVLIEPGSGSSEKIRLLLDQIKPKVYVPMDIAGDFLQSSAKKLYSEFTWLEIHAICADFSHILMPPEDLPQGKRIIFYPGSTIGNMQPENALSFLKKLKQWVEHSGGGIIIGGDLHKQSDILNSAYNDDQGITAAFNLNMLDNINRLFNANFNLDNFTHHAFYNETKRRIEMHLVSKLKQEVLISGTQIGFAEGETIHTENSYKYTLEDFSILSKEANFKINNSWIDEDNLFSVHFLS